MTREDILEELNVSTIAEFYAEEVTELASISNGHFPSIDNQELGEFQTDLSNWEVQVFEFEETLREHILA